MTIDKQSLSLLRAIVEQLEELGNTDSTQYFGFEIRGKRISGQLQIKLEDVELKVQQ